MRTKFGLIALKAYEIRYMLYGMRNSDKTILRYLLGLQF
ncbi:MAG: hypothetical protein ACJAWH_000506 [Maribacter sp.]|jgi:hypothetical protein